MSETKRWWAEFVIVLAVCNLPSAALLLAMWLMGPPGYLP